MVRYKFDMESFGMIQPSDVEELMRNEFDTVVQSDTPDFIFCGPFGYDYLNSKAVRIFSTGENIRPDFNLVDYAIGFDYMTFEDRYLRIPLYYFYPEDYKLALHKHDNLSELLMQKTEFCNFVYSNAAADPKREDFFYRMSEYKKVNSGGKILNNIGGPLPFEKDAKLDFQRKHKFSIVFENSSTSGYTTEKILQAFAAQTVPIYWGDPRIGEEFSEKAFINCMKFTSFDQVIELVKKLDTDDDAYMKYLKSPIFDKDVPEIDYGKKLRDFLTHIFSQTPEKAMRRLNVHRGLYYQEDIRKFRAVEKTSAYTYLLRFKKVK